MSASRAPAALAAMAIVLGAGDAAAQADGFSFKPRGRIQIDAQHRDWDVRAEDDTDLYVRRLYLGAQGRIHGAWRYKIAGYQYDQMTRRMADLLKPPA